MLSGSKIMAKTSVGRVIMVAIMRDIAARKTCSRIYVRGNGHCQDDSRQP